MKIINEVKEKLVQYFKNKERVLSANLKNYIIYQGTIEDSFQEIIRLYGIHGKIFYVFFFLFLAYYFNFSNYFLKNIIINTLNLTFIIK